MILRHHGQKRQKRVKAKDRVVSRLLRTDRFEFIRRVTSDRLVTDRPARNLFDGDKFSGGGLSRIAIPRHVASFSATMNNFDPRNTLPGAVNVSFADNHVESAKLETLSGLYWHKNWQPPAKRPGLP